MFNLLRPLRISSKSRVASSYITRNSCGFARASIQHACKFGLDPTPAVVIVAITSPLAAATISSNVVLIFMYSPSLLFSASKPTSRTCHGTSNRKQGHKPSGDGWCMQRTEKVLCQVADPHLAQKRSQSLLLLPFWNAGVFQELPQLLTFCCRVADLQSLTLQQRSLKLALLYARASFSPGQGLCRSDPACLPSPLPYRGLQHTCQQCRGQELEATGQSDS